jgi:DNA-directed RNA polymerase subunit RPC12/RpoP
MRIEATLTDMAIFQTEQLEVRVAALERERQELLARKAAIESELATAGAARKRLQAFRPKIGAEYKCPSCWMQRDQQSTLYPIGGGTPHEDHFRCSECRAQITVKM